MKKNRMKHAVIITAIVVITTTIIWLMIGFMTVKQKSQPNPPEYADGATYWCEIYEDGSMTIHTNQRWVTNSDEDLIIKGEFE